MESVIDQLCAENTDRPRGVLTEKERKYLLGISDIEPKSPEEREIRQQLRTHITHTLIDFNILFQFVEPRDRRRIWHGYDPSRFVETNSKPDTEPTIARTIPSTIAFLYQFYQEAHADAASYAFQRDVERGIQEAFEVMGRYANVDASIDVTAGDSIEEIYNRLEERGPAALNEVELRILYRHREIEQHELRFFHLIRNIEEYKGVPLTQFNDLGQAFAKQYAILNPEASNSEIAENVGHGATESDVKEWRQEWENENNTD